MGHDSVPVLSPAHRRGANTAPPNDFFRKPLPQVREDNGLPDLGWTSVFRRHKFLLVMLAILALLCSIYLYFAVMFTDSCAGLSGVQRTTCLLAKTSSEKTFHRRGGRALLADDSVWKFVLGSRSNCFRGSTQLYGSRYSELSMDLSKLDRFASECWLFNFAGWFSRGRLLLKPVSTEPGENLKPEPMTRDQNILEMPMKEVGRKQLK